MPDDRVQEKEIEDQYEAIIEKVNADEARNAGAPSIPNSGREEIERCLVAARADPVVLESVTEPDKMPDDAEAMRR